MITASKTKLEDDPVKYLHELLEEHHEVHLPPGMVIDIGSSVLILPSGSTLATKGNKPATLKGTKGSRVTIEGSKLGNEIELVEDTKVGSNVFTISSRSIITAGDYICVRTHTDGPLNVSSYVTGTTSADTFGGEKGLDFLDNVYNDLRITFTSGALNGESGTIKEYEGCCRGFTMEEGFSAPPQSGDTFNVWSLEYGTKTAPQQLLKVIGLNTKDGVINLVTDEPAAFDYECTGSSNKARLVKVSPVSNINLQNVNLDNVQVTLALAENVSIYCPKVYNSPMVRMNTKEHVACRKVSVKGKGCYGVEEGAHQVAMLVGISDLRVRLAQNGGIKDGVRIWGCNNVNGQVRLNKVPKRSLWLFACNDCTIKGRVTKGMYGSTGNVEVVVLDYTCNVKVTKLEVDGFADGDGLELRGTCKNIDLNNLSITSDPDGSANTLINIHGRSVSNVSINDFTLVGALHCIDVRDGPRNVRITNGSIQVQEGGGNCIRMGRHMVEPIESVLVSGVVMTPGEGRHAVLASDKDGSGNMMSNITVIDNTIVAPDAPIDDYIRIVHADKVTIDGNVVVI